MPIYEYQCNACGHEFEEWQRITDKPIRKCPKCEACKVEKLVSRSSFQLKGGGWYVTDYARSGASSEDTGNTKPSKSDKSDTKPSKSKKKDSAASTAS